MLDPKRLGTAGGIVWGVTLLVMTLIWMYFDYGLPFRDLMVSVYPGYSISPVGAVIGLFWGFLDAFIGFFLLAWIYNLLGGSE